MNSPQYKGKVFIYPCAGDDIVEPINAFGESFDTFLFVDVNYRSVQAAPVISGWQPVEGSQRRFGSRDGVVRYCHSGKHRYRVMSPEWVYWDYVSDATGRQIHVVLRRGFGQYALHELADNSLSMFMHRRDSSGEGGSSVFYLDNRRMDHEPISNLLDVIRLKLTMPGLIASDGSNTKITQLLEAAKGEEKLKSFRSNQLLWERLRIIKSELRMDTVVWRVSPDSL